MSEHPFEHYWIITGEQMTIEELEAAAAYDHTQWCGSFDGGANRKVRATDWRRIDDDHKRRHAATVMQGVEALRHIGWTLGGTDNE